MLFRSSAKEQAPRACSAAFNAASGREQEGHLRSARWFLLQCAKASCGGVAKKCAAGASRLASDLALVVPVVTDSSGAPLVDVVVKVDGEQIATRLDGRSLAIDPGLREISFSARAGGASGRDVTLTKKMMIIEGQRGAITVELPAAEPDPPKPPAEAPAQPVAPDPAEAAVPSEAASPTKDDVQVSSASVPVERPHRGPSPLSYVIGGVGVLGLGAGALLTYWGKTDNDDLARCAPNCSPSSLDHIKQMYLGADIAFGAGAAALGVATVLFVTSRKSGDAATTASSVHGKQAFTFSVGPIRSGGVASFGGVF